MKRPMPQGPSERVRDCQVCGATFYDMGASTFPQKYCSRPCAGRAKAKKRPKIICRGCGATFSPRKASDKRTYCSRTCASRARVADKHPRWHLKAKGEEGCRNCGRFATHLHHIVPRSRCSPEGKRDFRNGVPLCFECHHGWHHRRVVITRDKLTEEEEAFALELSDPVWMERNYPYDEGTSFVMKRLSVDKQVELVNRAGGIEEAVAILQVVADEEAA